MHPRNIPTHDPCEHSHTHRPRSYCFAHHHTISTHIDSILLQRFGGWAGDVFAVQVKMAVVTGTPDMAEVSSVLDDAGEVGADGSKGSEASFRSSNQDPGLASKTKDLPRVRFYLFRLHGKSDSPCRGFFHFRRNQVLGHWIEYGNEERSDARIEKPIQKTSAAYRSVHHLLIPIFGCGPEACPLTTAFSLSLLLCLFHTASHPFGDLFHHAGDFPYDLRRVFHFLICSLGFPQVLNL